jgi:hypothetical protein
MNTKHETDKGVTYQINEPTVKAQFVVNYILKAFKDADVKPEEVLPVLGEAVIRLLTSVAEVSGYEPIEMVKVFGEGIYTAELEYNKINGSDELQTSD